MRLGISTYTYTWSVGVPGSEPLHPWDEKKLIEKALKQLVQESCICIEVGARGMTPEHLECYLGIADLFGSDLLRFVIDGMGFRPSVKEAGRIIKGVLPLLESKGIRLVIENHDRLKVTMKKYPWQTYRLVPEPPSIVECNNYILQDLLGKGSAENTGEDNFETVRLVWAAYESARHNRVIEIGKDF